MLRNSPKGAFKIIALNFGPCDPEIVIIMGVMIADVLSTICTPETAGLFHVMSLNPYMSPLGEG